MAASDARSLGSRAEQSAARYLQRQGLTLLARNFRCRLGEIDLVALDGAQLVFVEVRYRGSGSYSRAGPTVDLPKQRKLIRTAALFVARNSRYAMHVMRFDVVAIDADEHDRSSVKWVRDAFRPADARL